VGLEVVERGLDRSEETVDADREDAADLVGSGGEDVGDARRARCGPEDGADRSLCFADRTDRLRDLCLIAGVRDVGASVHSELLESGGTGLDAVAGPPDEGECVALPREPLCGGVGDAGTVPDDEEKRNVGTFQ
jgi:hypothetical protein